MGRTRTEEELTAMLLENTGRHFLDSGGDSGRHWQQNQDRDLENEPPSKISFRYNDIEVTHHVYHWLRERLRFDEEATCAFDGPFREACDPDDDRSWGELREEFPGWFAGWRSREDTSERCPSCNDAQQGCEVCSGTGVAPGDVSLYAATGIYGEGERLTVNTYNEENLLDQTLLFTYFELRAGPGRGGLLDSYLVLQIHGGCDVRGGYTRPRLFVIEDDDELAIFDCRRATILCDADPDHYWTTDDGRHWYAQGACGRGAGAQLEAYERVHVEGAVVDDLQGDERWQRGSVCVDDEDHGFCPSCGGTLRASSR
jgi:hypothetical protein